MNPKHSLHKEKAFALAFKLKVIKKYVLTHYCNCYRFFVPLYEIVVYSFCRLLKYVVLEGKLCPPQCDTYQLNIHYCCPLTEAESVTKDCASRQNHLQSGQASLRKHVSIQQHILPLPEMVCK